MNGTETARISPAQVLSALAAAVESGLPHPLHIGIKTESTGYGGGWHGVEIRLANNLSDDLSGWAEWLGLGDAVPGPVLESNGRDWRAHRAEGAWQGWHADLWSAVDEPAEVES